MNYQLKFHRYFLIIAIWIMSCNRGPKVISASNENQTENSTGIFSEAPVAALNPADNSAGKSNVHTVIIEEILPTSKYVYLYVKEDEDQYWIATNKQEVNIGETYFYREGLLKTNFKSTEYDRTFDRLYLVSNIVPANHGNTANMPVSSERVSIERIERKGSVKIAELKKNPKKYEGKTIQVSGKCVKVNLNIMGKNWIHINDGSIDDYDLVITSTDVVSVGEKVTMRGSVTLNKDLGAGYFFDIILEDGKVIK